MTDPTKPMTDATPEQLLTLAEPNADLVAILGRPNFMCGQLAEVLRKGGANIPRKSEHEQAHVILFLLKHWLSDPESWAENAMAALRNQEHLKND